MPKFTPERMCIVCRNSFPKQSLMRFVLAGGEVVADRNQKAEGRGVYLCKNDGCVFKCIKSKSLNRAFKQNLSEDAYRIVKEEYDGLQQT